jgi:hypothetical protein
MPRHLITTASLLQAIDDQRAEEASTRWDEITREFMTGGTDDSDRADSAAAV